jgi:hypothetical protein
MKKPYVKIYDTQGVCINPITKENPYLHKADSMLLRKKKKKQPKNNKSGYRIVILKFGYGLISKFHAKQQLIKCNDGTFKTVFHYIEKTIIKTKITNKQV